MITAAFVRRPPLVFVLLALMALAGTLAYRSLVQQQFPNVSVPTISVSVLYSGASPTVMRDTIVRPIEDAIAGTPDLQFQHSERPRDDLGGILHHFGRQHGSGQRAEVAADRAAPVADDPPTADGQRARPKPSDGCNVVHDLLEAYRRPTLPHRR